MIPLTGYQGRRVAVLGLGRSGMATVEAARAGGAIVAAWDDNAAQRNLLPEAEVADLSSFDWREGDVLVPAPGIPLNHPAPHPIIRQARASGATVLGDVELFQQSCPDALTIGVTGTNGKSTTTALIAHILQSCGRDALAAGNIGRAVLDLDPPTSQRVHVFELSSYQLDLADSFHPRVGVFLNLTPDHLDRHGDMAGYMKAKERLFRNMTAEDVAVVGVDDDHGRELAQRLIHRSIPTVCVSVSEALPQGIYALRGQIFDNGLVALNLAEASALPGQHNHQNAAVAYAVCRALDCKPAAIAAAIRTFPGLPHRIERLGQLAGVSFYNDSKATNAEAAAKALSAFENIHWIVGGKPKEGGVASLRPLMDRVARAYLIGEAQAAFADQLDGAVDTRRCGTLAAATEAAFHDAQQNGSGIVLLSPACASFDQFPNFEARGDAFRAAVDYILSREREGGAG